MCVAAALCVWMSVCILLSDVSYDTSGCSCSLVASPSPSDAVPALWCVSTSVMCAAVCLLYVSAVKRRVAVLHVRPLRHPLAVCSCCVVVVVVIVDVVCRALVRTCMASLWLRCDLHERRIVAGWRGGMTASGTRGLSGCVILGDHSHTVLCVSDSMQCADWRSFCINRCCAMRCDALRRGRLAWVVGGVGLGLGVTRWLFGCAAGSCICVTTNSPAASRRRWAA